VYIAGTTAGSLGGPFAGGAADAFIAKFDADGAFLWTHQVGTSNDDEGTGVSADGFGHVYASGGTLGDMDTFAAVSALTGGHKPPKDHSAKYDPFLVKLIPEPSTYALAVAAGLGAIALLPPRRKVSPRGENSLNSESREFD
jgi:hypothetical protein